MTFPSISYQNTPERRAGDSVQSCISCKETFFPLNVTAIFSDHSRLKTSHENREA